MRTQTVLMIVAILVAAFFAVNLAMREGLLDSHDSDDHERRLVAVKRAIAHLPAGGRPLGRQPFPDTLHGAPPRASSSTGESLRSNPRRRTIA